MSMKAIVHLALSAIVFSAGGLAVDTALAQDSKKIVKVATIPYPPLEFKDPKTGELTGFNHDLLDAMIKKAGMTPNWVEMSFADQATFAPLKTGRVDIYGGTMADTPVRREAGANFLNFMYEPYYFYVLSANAAQAKNAEALCGKTVANSRSSTAMVEAVQKWSDENCSKAGRPPVVQVGASNTPEQVMLLRQGRVDAGFTGVGFLLQSKRTEGDVYTPIGKPLAKMMYGFAFANSNRELGEALRKALDGLIADGTYTRLLQKWGMPVEDTSIGPASLVNAGK